MSRKAFTLVELLVVITIIGILTGLVTAAAVAARRRAKIATIVMEVKQLETACQAYKERFGEYPPDFSGIGGELGIPEPRNTARRIVLRHLARAFPRYQNANDWNGFVADLDAGWHVDAMHLSPASALILLLGGQPDWMIRTVAGGGKPVGTPKWPADSDFDAQQPVKGFLGFSANPQNPFDGGSSHIAPFFDFDATRVGYRVMTILNKQTPIDFTYWPQGAYGDKTSGAIRYFRAENGAYTLAYVPSGGTTQVNLAKLNWDMGDPQKPAVQPAVDVRLSAAGNQYTWVNPKSFQILSAGMDLFYSQARADAGFYPSSSSANSVLYVYGVPAGVGPYEFPTGGNYDARTYDDITNFSNGTLEDAIP